MRRTLLPTLFVFVIFFAFVSVPPTAKADTVTFTSTLHLGSHGTQVSALQDLLYSMQYLPNASTGYFGRLTQTAVMAFQRMYGLEPVGFTGVKTRAVLNGIVTGTIQRIPYGTTPTTPPAPTSTPVTNVSPTMSFTSSTSTALSSTGVLLSWTSTQMTSCTASGSWSGVKNVSGTYQVSNILNDQTYTLTCTGINGSTQQQTLTVKVATATPTLPAPSVTFTTSAATVASGGSATLGWNSTNTTSCSASGGWSGTKGTSGTQVVSQLTSTQSYSLLCLGSDGSQVVKTVTITVTPVTPVAQVPTVALNISTANIASGGSITLSWSATDGSSCVASGGWTGTQATTGSTVISNVTANQTYTLTCTNSAGTSSKSVSVTAITQNPNPNPNPTPAPTPTPTPSGTGTVVHNASELSTALSAVNGIGGVTIQLAPGNYGDVTLGQWNTGYNFPSVVTITSQDPSNRAVFSTLFLQNNNGIKLANFNVVAPSSVLAIRTNVNKNITIGGIKVTCPDKTGTGISSRTDSGILITNNDVGNCATAISAYQENGPVVITRNNVHDVEGDAIDIYSNAGYSATVTISENYIHDFSPLGADHPDGIQFTAYGASVTPTITDNLITRGFYYGGVFPEQGIFISDGPGYTNPTVSGNLLIGTLYNGITVADAVGGTITNNSVISFPDYGSWIRYEDDTNLTISNNVSSSLVSVYPTANTNITFSNNTYTSGVADMNAAVPIMNTWRASHPNVPSETTSPVVAMSGVAHGTVAGASTAQVFTKFLSAGTSGAQVTALQNLMVKLGYLDASKVTGYFGPSTAKAVMSFQKAKGLGVTGAVGPLTRAALNASEGGTL